jgi:hypothetical protein
MGVGLDSTTTGASVAGALGVFSTNKGSGVAAGSSVGGTLSGASVAGGIASSASTPVGNPSDVINENKITIDDMVSFFVYFIAISPYHP